MCSGSGSGNLLRFWTIEVALDQVARCGSGELADHDAEREGGRKPPQDRVQSEDVEAAAS